MPAQQNAPSADADRGDFEFGRAYFGKALYRIFSSFTCSDADNLFK